MDIPRRLAIKVGAFGALAVVVAFAVLLLVGGDGTFLSRTRTYHTAFPDVAGLREGAVVRLGGRAAGEVDEIVFGPLGASQRGLIVTFHVLEGFAERVRADAVVRIGSQGLLGDKLLDLTLGSASAPEVQDGGWLAGETPADPARLISAATSAAEHARNILERFDEKSKELEGGGAFDELRAGAAALGRLADRIEQGPGLAHTLIYDERFAAETARAVSSLARAADQGSRAMSDARRVMARVEAVSSAVDPAKVKATVDNLAQVTDDVRAGRGTLGGLIEDPTLYEETKRILVNIRRNRVLKTLARMVISEDTPGELMDASPVHPRKGPPERVNVSGKNR